MVRAVGQSCFAACTLDDLNALHFGTRLRAYALKTIINRFLNAHTLLGFKSHLKNQKSTYKVCTLLMVRAVGLEPTRRRHWLLRPTCLPFHHARGY